MPKLIVLFVLLAVITGSPARAGQSLVLSAGGHGRESAYLAVSHAIGTHGTVERSYESSLPAAQTAGSGRRRSVGVRENPFEFFPLAGYDPTLAATDDLEPLRRIVGDATVVALGESYHTSGGFYLMKHRIFRFLVEEMGFRAFAMETNWQSAERAAAYVQTCGGTAEEAIRGESVWESTEYADLLRWMCEWNSVHPDPADKLAMFGFDIQQPWHDGPGLVTFLQRIGISPNDWRSDGLHSCEQAFTPAHMPGEIPPALHNTCVQALDAIEQHLRTNQADVQRRTSKQDFDIALLRVIGLRAWEESAFTIARDFSAGFNVRDEAMAYAFHVRRAMKAPNAKTVVWAANMHVTRNPLEGEQLGREVLLPLQPIGSFLAATFGQKYVTFALTAYDTEVDFGNSACGLVSRTPDSVEERLAKFGHGALLVRPRRGPRPDEAAAMGLNLVRPYEDYDGIIFLAHSPKMHPLGWPSCR
jgi:erythromycin esterase-like protein